MFRCTLSCLLLTFVTQCASAGEEIEAAAVEPLMFPGTDVAVTLKSGRVLRGKVDQRTDTRYLWVMAETEGMRVGSRIPLNDVASITSSTPIVLPIPLLPLEHPPLELLSESRSKLPPVAPLPVGLPSARPHSLEVFARAANWDNDPEADGLRVLIIPRARNGNYVVAPGTISAALTTYRGEWRDRLERVPNAERWGRELTAVNFGSDGAVLEFPFENLNLDLDRSQNQDRLLMPLGELHVRLNVSGVGTFDARQQDVELRPFALTDDFRQLTIEPPPVR